MSENHHRERALVSYFGRRPRPLSGNHRRKRWQAPRFPGSTAIAAKPDRSQTPVSLSCKQAQSRSTDKIVRTPRRTPASTSNGVFDA
jgi:hypothetical protein